MTVLHYFIMSSKGSSNHNKRLASETDKSQRLLDNDSAQHLKLKDRQLFFEEVYHQDVNNYLPSAHLQIDSRKPPMGSISSMEVNVDVLEQMDLMDVSDQEVLDVFLNSGSGADEGALAEVEDDDEEAEVVYRVCPPLLRQNEVLNGSKSRLSSTSSGSSDTSGDGADTPVIQSDDEEVHADTPVIQSDDEEVHADTQLLTSVAQPRDEETEDEEEEQRGPGTKPSQRLKER
ncbi:dysbindin-like isoform X2 [Entelurus aequoreus]|uniref:dysbindin-like isoform X2 n=1 Tax=Entelurus aequoreus TaxID=161455 RepID=UPI002B1E7C45|nr:dysbindin-like isoform X2 [Entelurus aequoreus]